MLLNKPVEVHNLLISKKVLICCDISNPALNHELHNPVNVNHSANCNRKATKCKCSM